MKDKKKDNKINKNNAYYICEECGDLTTEGHLLEEISIGGRGLCMCRFFYRFWNGEIDCPDIETDKILLPYTQIGEKHYQWLLSEDNTIKRLRMFSTINKKLLPKNGHI